MLLVLLVLVIVVLAFISSQLGMVAKTLGEIREIQDKGLHELVRLAGDEPMQVAIEHMNDAGATLTQEMLDYRHGILVKMNAKLEGIASAVWSLTPDTPLDPPSPTPSATP